MTKINLTVDGAQVSDDVEPRMLLVQYLREKLGKTGTVIGCDTSNCGACTVHLDGTSVKSCNVLAVQADGSEVTTIEGLAATHSGNGELHPVQEAFRECHGLQCGFCTPGMVMQTRRPAQQQPEAERGGDPARARGQPLPLHRLPQHRPRCAARIGPGGELMTAVQDAPAAAPEIGRDRRRKEDQRLITGRTRWTDNITLPGMLHLAMVRSPFAHAKIVSIDTSAAKASTNVVDVLTGADLGEGQGVNINAWPITPEQVAPVHLPMPSDRVAFAGETVAVVVARTAAEARDAAELVDVEYDELPAALDLKKSAADEVLAHPDLGTNKSALWVFDSGEAGTGGNVDEAIAKARTDGIVIEREYRQQRLIPAFMEPRSVVVDPTGEQITMWSATQIPHILRFALAATTGVPESKIRVIAPDVGGGFGGKLQTTPEEFIAWAVARRLGKPVKYTETRSESPW